MRGLFGGRRVCRPRGSPVAGNTLPSHREPSGLLWLALLVPQLSRSSLQAPHSACRESWQPPHSLAVVLLPHTALKIPRPPTGVRMERVRSAFADISAVPYPCELASFLPGLQLFCFGGSSCHSFHVKYEQGECSMGENGSWERILTLPGFSLFQPPSSVEWGLQ